MSEIKAPASGLPVVQAGDIKTDRLTLKADVVVVGSGAGGAVTAYELARQGLDVIVLEAGPYIPSKDFTEHFSEALESLYEDHGAQANRDGDLLILQGRCVGGSTVVNGCVSFRTPDFILEEWREFHGLENMTPETLEPYFERVERNLSIADNGPHEIARHSQLITAGAKKLGWSVKPHQRNVKQCALTGHCLSGCKTERKQSMLVTYLPWAVAHGARIHSDTRVTRVLAENGEARGVEAEVVDPVSGAKVADLRIDAPRVVLAAGAVQTPLLLLKSGLANASGEVGKNFACHPSFFVLARYPEPVHAWRGALLGSYIDEFMRPEKGAFILEGGGLGVAEMTMITEPGTGEPFVRYMQDVRHYSGLVTLIHDHNVGTISLRKGHKDIQYRLVDKDFSSMIKALSAAARLHFASGATEVFMPTTEHRVIRNEAEIEQVVSEVVNRPQHLRMVSYHPQGSCRMGADPARSVVGPNGETHDVRGLFVADASLIPTSTLVNPQTTVYAMASYIADHMLGLKPIAMAHRRGEVA